MLGWILLILSLLVLMAAFLYWLLIVTEGVYLGRRVVVWLYDLTADRYDGIKEFDAAAESFFVARPLLRALDAKANPLVLDVATGTGRAPYFLLEEPTFNGRVVGIDASARMLGYAAQKLGPFGRRALLIRQTAERLPFAGGRFDAVTCLESLEFLSDEIRALREMVHVLRPGGLLMITRRRGWEGRSFVTRYRSAEATIDLLRDLGLQEIQIQPWQIEYDLVLAFKTKHNNE